MSVVRLCVVSILLIGLSGCHIDAVLDKPKVTTDWQQMSNDAGFTVAYRMQGKTDFTGPVDTFYGEIDTLAHYYYRLDAAPFDTYGKLRVDFHWYNPNGEKTDSFWFTSADLGKVVEGEAVVFGQSGLKLAPELVEFQPSGEPYETTVVSTDGIVRTGTFRYGRLQRGLLVDPTTETVKRYQLTAMYENGTSSGRMSLVKADGGVGVAYFEDGERDGLAVTDLPGAPILVEEYDNGTDVTASAPRTYAREQLAAVRSHALDEIDTKYRDAIQVNETRARQLRDEARSSVSDVVRMFADPGDDPCYCVFNGCLTMSDSTQTAAEKAASERRWEAKVEACIALRDAGIDTASGMSVMEMLRSPDFSPGDSSMGRRLANAQRAIESADRLMAEAREAKRRKAAEKAALEARLEATGAAETRAAIARYEAERLERAEREAERERQFMACLADHGYDIHDPEQNWSVVPQAC